MQDKSNKRFWDRFAKIYTGFMSKNNAAYNEICTYLERYINDRTSVLEIKVQSLIQFSDCLAA